MGNVTKITFAVTKTNKPKAVANKLESDLYVIMAIIMDNFSLSQMPQYWQYTNGLIKFSNLTLFIHHRVYVLTVKCPSYLSLHNSLITKFKRFRTLVYNMYTFQV